MNINDYGRTHEELIAIMSMPDSSPWKPTICPACGASAQVRETGLRNVAITGDENAGGHEFRASETVDLLWKTLNRLLRECQWTRERNGYYVESRSGNGDGVAHMLRDAEEAHRRYVHEHGE